MSEAVFIVNMPRRPLGDVIEGRTCYAYFHGRNGDGICSKGCQWFVEDAPCPWWWEKEEDWQAAKKARAQVGMEDGSGKEIKK